MRLRNSLYISFWFAYFVKNATCAQLFYKTDFVRILCIHVGTQLFLRLFSHSRIFVKSGGSYPINLNYSVIIFYLSPLYSPYYALRALVCCGSLCMAFCSRFFAKYKYIAVPQGFASDLFLAYFSFLHFFCGRLPFAAFFFFVIFFAVLSFLRLLFFWLGGCFCALIGLMPLPLFVFCAGSCVGLSHGRTVRWQGKKEKSCKNPAYRV